MVNDNDNEKKVENESDKKNDGLEELKINSDNQSP